MRVSKLALAVLLSTTGLAAPCWALGQTAQAASAAPAPAASAPTAATPSASATPNPPVHKHRYYRHRRRHTVPPATAATPGALSGATPGSTEAPPSGPVDTTPAPPPRPQTHKVLAPPANPPIVPAPTPAPLPTVQGPPHETVQPQAVIPVVPAPPPAPGHAFLGHGLTPLGAIQAGNDEGSIPAWNGGLKSPPAGFVNGGEHPNPYADEKPLFAISSANMAQYAPRLSLGMQAMLKQYPGFRVDVYPSHRSAAMPQEILNAAMANARAARLAPDGNSVLGARLTIPFPVPQNGLEAIWNHLLRFRGYQAHFTSYAATPTTSGDYTLIKNETKLLINYAVGGNSDSGPLLSFLVKTLAPPLYSGQLALAIDHVDPSARPRDAWVYSPGESRVRRAPEVNFDTPLVQADSLVTDDDLDIFNGSPERYNWQLVGRREIYVPYNTYEFGSQKHDYSEILKPLFVNPDLLRWELHRVWVVDATLKPGKHHIYPHRTYYFDEDSWEGLLGEDYDRRGEIWRIAMGAPEEFYEVPALTNSANLFFDLQARRYHIRGMRNKDSFIDFLGPRMKPSEFTADALRDTGVR